MHLGIFIQIYHRTGSSKFEIRRLMVQSIIYELFYFTIGIMTSNQEPLKLLPDEMGFTE